MVRFTSGWNCDEGDKLVFVGLAPNYLSLRTSPLKWCGNPLVRGEMYRQLPYRAGKRYDFWW